MWGKVPLLDCGSHSKNIHTEYYGIKLNTSTQIYVYRIN